MMLKRESQGERPGGKMPGNDNDGTSDMFTHSGVVLNLEKVVSWTQEGLIEIPCNLQRSWVSFIVGEGPASEGSVSDCAASSLTSLDPGS